MELVGYERDDRVALITLKRPEPATRRIRRCCTNSMRHGPRRRTTRTCASLS